MGPADDTPSMVCSTTGDHKVLSDKVLLNIQEFSTLANISPRTTAKLIASGELRSIRVGRRRLIARTELTRFAKSDHATHRTGSACPTKEADNA